MDLKSYWRSMPKDERKQFAAECSCSYGHLINVVYGYRRCTAELALKIEKRSRGIVKKEEIAPHVEW